MPKYRILVATHGTKIHTIEFDSNAGTLTPIPSSSLELKEQPSWIAQSPVHNDLVYTNSWVENMLYAVRVEQDGFLYKVAETRSGGEGPTFIEVAKDGSALIVANYRSGTVSYHPIDSNGLFIYDSPLPNHVLQLEFPHTAVLDERQESPHPHHVVALGNDWLVPDLGSDIIWRLKWDGDATLGRWTVTQKFEVERFSGPRHVTVHPDGETLYVINELTSTITTLAISPSTTVSTVPILPPELRSLERQGPYDLIAAEILLLPPLASSSTAVTGRPLTLLATNRNAPTDLAPNGDSLAKFTIPSSKPTVLSEPTFIYGCGSHLRGLSCGPTTGEEAFKFVLVQARNGGGMSVLERQGDGSELSELCMNQSVEIELPVGALWLL